MKKYLIINSAFESHQDGIMTAENELEAKIKFVENCVDNYGRHECYSFFIDMYDADENNPVFIRNKVLDELATRNKPLHRLFFLILKTLEVIKSIREKSRVCSASFCSPLEVVDERFNIR